MNNTSSKWANYSIIIAAICLLIYFGGNIILPFVFAIFITILMLPMVNFLERIHFPKWLAALFSVLLITAFIGGIGFFVYNEIIYVIRDLPQLIQENTGKEAGEAEEWIAGLDLGSKIQSLSSYIVTNSAEYLQSLVAYVSSTLMMIVTIPVYVLFMLIYRERIDVFIKYKYKNNLENAKEVAVKISKSIQRYIVGLFFVVLTVGILLSTGLYFLEIPYWLLLGIICALLTLLPYIGVIIGALLPLTIAFLTKDSLFYPVSVLVLLVLVQFLEGNLITPKIIGNAVNLNPIVLILGLLIMGALSGILGLILIIPMLAVIRILLDSSEELKPYGKLMENEDEK